MTGGDAASELGERGRRPPSPAAPALDVRQLVVRFGGVVAVDNIDFTASRGEVTGLIGPNGAGKTTVLDAVCGFTAATGQVHIDGRRLDGMAPHRRSRLGLGRTFQQAQLFVDLTVFENVLVGAHRQRDPAEAADAAIRALGLDAVQRSWADELPHGVRQQVALARAVASDPAVLLLDEPAAGLDPRETARLGRVLRRIADQGACAVVLVDHDMDLVLDVCDRITVLQSGRVIAGGTPTAVMTDPVVRHAYLGRAAS